ncbi:MAG: hypothetical protein HFG22_16330 [Lachnospiraceae bacterium]|nr:hypothetical protein [Lachnospiraceae bacterium]
MKFIIDNADIKKIQAIYDVFPVDGVTTNPTILAESGRQPFEVLKGIRAWIGAEAELHVQAVSRSTEGMIEDGHRIVKELGEGTYIKIPSIPAGFKAMRALKAEGLHVTATAIQTG